MSSDSETVERLADLLRAELCEIKFSVFKFEESAVQHTSGESFVADVKQQDEFRFDAEGLREFHDNAEWKRQLFHSPYRVMVWQEGPRGGAREKAFERMLEDLGGCTDGFVGHSLGDVLPGATERKWHEALPAFEGEVSVGHLWEYALIDACLHSAAHTAKKLVDWIKRGTN